MAVMQKLKMSVVQEPVVATSCLIAGFGLFLPAVVRPNQGPKTCMSDPNKPMVGHVSLSVEASLVAISYTLRSAVLLVSFPLASGTRLVPTRRVENSRLNAHPLNSLFGYHRASTPLFPASDDTVFCSRAVDFLSDRQFIFDNRLNNGWTC